MDLSVIIVSYNCREYLEQALRSVYVAVAEIESEVFVIDNNSSDGTAEMVQKLFPMARLVANKVNKGFSAACNQGLQNASGKYILLLNPDTIVNPETFTECINFMEKKQNAGAVGVRMTDGSGVFLKESKRAFPDPLTAFNKLSGLGALFPSSEKINRYYLAGIKEDQTAEVEILTGAFMFMRQEALIKAGFLDERFFMFGEDIDLSYRLMQTGFSNWYYSATSIIHFKGKSTGKAKFRSLLHFYRSMFIFVNKYYAKKTGIIMIPFLYSGILLRCAIAFAAMGFADLISFEKK